MARRKFPPVLICLAALLVSTAGQAKKPIDESPVLRTVTVGDGVELHYVDRGSGVPVVFVHGSLGEGGFWNDEVAAFSQHFRAIAYSRRYNFPNTNKSRPGYSAVVDADDLAALVQKLHLGKAHIVGHSYGAYASLFLAIKHPELVRTLALAEPPAVTLLADLPGSQAEAGKTLLADIRNRMVDPMKAAFRKGDRDAGIRAFLSFLLNDPDVWEKVPEAARQQMLRGAAEWDVMMTTGEMFPELDPREVRKIHVPVLLMSGEMSFPFLKLVDEELGRLLPEGRHLVLPGATHDMWSEQPETCRKAVLDFWRSLEDDKKPRQPQ